MKFSETTVGEIAVWLASAGSLMTLNGRPGVFYEKDQIEGAYDQLFTLSRAINGQATDTPEPTPIALTDMPESGWPENSEQSKPGNWTHDGTVEVKR